MEKLKINIHDWHNLDETQRESLCRRVEAAITTEVMDTVREVIEAVRREGDAAIMRYTEKFDGADLEGVPLRAAAGEFRSAEQSLDEEVKRAIEFAVENVRRVHEQQRPGCLELCEVRPGVFSGERFTPIPSVGLYVPRGRGSFPSVMYMQAIPAVIAGVKRIAAVSPPDKRGRIDPACLYTAKICGVEEVYRIGGVQGIAALAFGSESIPRVDKILGPGSLYVAAAKRALADRVDVGMPAGPSEAIVLADQTADPRLAALDLITEAEHGSDSSAFLVTPSRKLAQAVERELPSLLAELDPPRAAFVRDVLSGYGGIVVTETMEQAIDFVNRYAPEHLQIACREPITLLGRIENAGEILLGQNSAFSMANYAVGCNNVIPTGGWARTCSPLSVRAFLKSSSAVYVASQGISQLSGAVAALAGYEGFSAHAMAVRRRVQGAEAASDDSPPTRHSSG
ncbi:MAG: histidinol dehydrogenase [Spirochaetaceae bacterium]|nr:MAG: histidinol dehydrogenase [Spirochaetaceae bacterium]